MEAVILQALHAEPSDETTWLALADWYNDGRLCRSAFRSRRVPEYQFDRLGFRVTAGQGE
jgi:uncharacterized protein (TIGR02996 family)